MVLQWHRVDTYHFKTFCGRFSVSRVTVKGCPHYIAWNRREPATEIGTLVLGSRATDNERRAALASMQELCQKHAWSSSAATSAA